jgi:hypothetical protein
MPRGSAPLLSSSNSYERRDLSRAPGQGLTDRQKQEIAADVLNLKIPEKEGGQWNLTSRRLGDFSKLDLHERLLNLFQEIQTLEAQLRQQNQAGGAAPANQQMQQRMMQMQQQLVQMQQQAQMAQAQLKRVTEIIQPGPGEDPMMKLQTIMRSGSGAAAALSSTSTRTNGDQSDNLYQRLLQELDVADQSEAYEKIQRLQEDAAEIGEIKVAKSRFEGVVESIAEVLGVEPDADIISIIQDREETTKKAIEERDVFEAKLDSLKELLPPDLREMDIDDGIKKLVGDAASNASRDAGDVIEIPDTPEESADAESDAKADESSSNEDTRILNKLVALFKKHPKDKIYEIISRLYERYIKMQKMLTEVVVPGIKTAPEKLRLIYTFYQEVKNVLSIDADENALELAIAKIKSLQENQKTEEETEEVPASEPEDKKAKSQSEDKEAAEKTDKEVEDKRREDKPEETPKKAKPTLAERFRNLGKPSTPRNDVKPSVTPKEEPAPKKEVRLPAIPEIKPERLPDLPKKAPTATDPKKATPAAEPKKEESVEERNKRKEDMLRMLEARIDSNSKKVIGKAKGEEEEESSRETSLDGDESDQGGPSADPSSDKSNQGGPPPRISSKADALSRLEAMIDGGRMKVDTTAQA